LRHDRVADYAIRCYLQSADGEWFGFTFQFRHHLPEDFHLAAKCDTHAVECHVTQELLEVIADTQPRVMLWAGLIAVALIEPDHTIVELVSAVYHFHDVVHRDFVGCTCECEAAASAFGGHQQSLADKVLEDLGNEMSGQVGAFAQFVKQYVAVGS